MKRHNCIDIAEQVQLFKLRDTVDYYLAAEVDQLLATVSARKTELLMAARDLLRRQVNSHYVLNLLEETVRYDDAQCDGRCLLDDIEHELAEANS